MRYKYVFLFTALTSRHVAIASPTSSQPQKRVTTPEPPANLTAPVFNVSVINFDPQSLDYTPFMSTCPADKPDCGLAPTNQTRRDLADIKSTKFGTKRGRVEDALCGTGRILYTSECVDEMTIKITCHPFAHGSTYLTYQVHCTADSTGINDPGAFFYSTYVCVDNMRPPPFTRARCVVDQIIARWGTPTQESSTGYAGIGPIKPGPIPGNYFSTAATAVYDKFGRPVSVESLGFFRYDPRFLDMGSCSRAHSCVSTVAVDWTTTSAWAWVTGGVLGNLTAISYIIGATGL